MEFYKIVGMISTNQHIKPTRNAHFAPQTTKQVHIKELVGFGVVVFIITRIIFLYFFFLKAQDSDYMGNESKVASERNQIGNYVTIASSAVDTRRYPTLHA